MVLQTGGIPAHSVTNDLLDYSVEMWGERTWVTALYVTSIREGSFWRRSAYALEAGLVGLWDEFELPGPESSDYLFISVGFRPVLRRTESGCFLTEGEAGEGARMRRGRHSMQHQRWMEGRA